MIVAAEEFVEIDHVALQTKPECTAEYCGRLERGGANAIIVEGDLIRTGKI